MVSTIVAQQGPAVTHTNENGGVQQEHRAHRGDAEDTEGFVRRINQHVFLGVLCARTSQQSQARRRRVRLLAHRGSAAPASKSAGGANEDGSWPHRHADGSAGPFARYGRRARCAPARTSLSHPAPAVCRLLLSPVGCGKACRSVARRTRPFKPACGNSAGPCEQRSIVTATPRRPGPHKKNGDAWALASPGGGKNSSVVRG